MKQNDSTNDNEIIKSSGLKQSNKIITSYGVGYTLMEIWNAVFGTYVFFFYETEVKLFVWLISFGYILYAIWNSFNDPILGYLFDRPNRLWKRWGKRFPIIVIAAIPWFLCMTLILTPPNVNPVDGAWILFGWLVFTTCLFDTFYSAFQNSHYSLFPDKFRLDSDRRKSGGIGWALGTVGTALGALIPPFLISYGIKSTYTNMALVVFVVSVIFFIFLIPGVRETKYMIERYKIRDVNKEKESFITSAKKALKQKNFMTIVFITLIGDIAFACLLASIHYFIKYYLQEPASYATIVMAAFLIGALLSIPLWFYLIKKLNNNRKMHIIGIIFLLILILPLSFFWDLTSMIVVLILLGIGQVAFKIARFPCLADTIDESVVNTGVRQESVYMGVQTFWMRFSLIAQALIFAIVHELTGFNPDVIQQTDLALFGFRLQASIIPAIFIFVGLIVFWKFYDLTPEKTKRVKEKLKELGL